MHGGLSWILVGFLAVALGYAAVSDWRARIISNRLNITIALLAIPFWWSTGVEIWPDVAWRVGIAAIVFGLFTLAFAYGAMGGGDVKMVGALALWLPPLAVLKLLTIMSLAGGLLTLAMLIRHKASKSPDILEIPYGIAIAFGGFWLLGERILNQFS